ncbi:MAG: DUF354 domain-containing protein [Sphaerochaetaceae bacterium]|nr:DUF354 domain-containing protein [Sphaerochaetaceae bacterium]
MSGKRAKLWFDFENAPQVLVLEPLIRRFREEGYGTVLTARRFSMTVELCRKRGLDAVELGSGSTSGSTVVKILKVFQRAFKLKRLLKNQKPLIGISHASRSQLLAGKMLGVPVVILDDYEHSDQSLVRFASRLLAPYAIPAEVWGRHSSKVVQYPGIKENLYLTGLTMSNDLPPDVLANPDSVILLFRPESGTAHYHSEESARLQREILDMISMRKGVLVVVFPRCEEQRIQIRELFADRPAMVTFPEVTDGPNLIAHSDLVIGGGGTMTREAAALGVPSYSFFSGEWGGVDRQLVTEGRLVRIRNSKDVAGIRIEQRKNSITVPDSETLDFVYGYLKKVIVELRAADGTAVEA